MLAERVHIEADVFGMSRDPRDSADALVLGGRPAGFRVRMPVTDAEDA
jgi:hypothetical protein